MTDGEPTDLVKEAKRRQNSNWTPLDALEFALEDLRKGVIHPYKIAILIEHQLDPTDPESNVAPVHYASQMGTSDFLAMLEIQKVMALQRWLGPMWVGPEIPPSDSET